MSRVIMPGRYQPFTKGHLLYYQTLRNHFDEVIIGLVERKNWKPDENNPFSWYQRLAFIKKVLPNSIVRKCSGLYIPKLKEKFGDDIYVAAGGDRCDVLDKQGGNVYYVKDRLGGIEATLVRGYLVDGQKSLFQINMPSQLWNEFPKMRKIMLDVMAKES